jgi:DNA mismatch repair protein MSH3
MATLQPLASASEDAELIQSLFRSGLLRSTHAACVSALRFVSEQAGGSGANPPSTRAGSAASNASKAKAAAAAAFRGSRGARFAAAALRKTLKTVSLSESLSVEAAESAFPEVEEARAGVAAGLTALEQDLLDARRVLDKPALEFRSLRTGVSASVEFLVELTKRDAARCKVPSEWVAVSSTSQFTRYHTPAVLEHMEGLARARETLELACSAAWQSLLERLSVSLVPALRAVAAAVAELDALASLAHLASQPRYTRPIIVEASAAPAGVWAVAARHPVAELAGQSHTHASLASTSSASAAGSVAQSGVYVPNPIALGDRPSPEQLEASTRHSREAGHAIAKAVDAVGNGLRCAVLTGPNMNGKSSYARCGALVAIMAQLGSYVPADACVVSPFDGVFTRMGSSDDLEGGMSTFMVEMSQSASILQAATRRSLVIMDELGRGTATHDGTALAQATLEHTVERLQCPAVFITHFPELSSAADALALAGHPVGNLHMAFLERPADQLAEAVVFLYRVQYGSAGKSYGLNVARMAGIPSHLIELARTWSSGLHRRVLGSRSEVGAGDRS